MTIGVPGEEIDPTDFENPIFSTAIELDPPESAASIAIKMNHNYVTYVDNTGSGGATTRLWLDTPDDGELVLGPRAGGANLAQVRIRHDKVSAVAGVVLRQDSGGVLYLTSSSRRYKTEIGDHEIDLDAVRGIRPVRFKDRGQINDFARRYAEERGEREPTEADVERATAEAQWVYGAIAEEIHDLGLDMLVTYEDDPEVTGGKRPSGLRYELFGLAAMQLIKQQSERIASLEERLARLEERIA